MAPAEARSNRTEDPWFVTATHDLRESSRGTTGRYFPAPFCAPQVSRPAISHVLQPWQPVTGESNRCPTGPSASEEVAEAFALLHCLKLARLPTPALSNRLKVRTGEPVWLRRMP